MLFSQSLGVVALTTLAAAHPSKTISTREVGQRPALGWNGWVSSSPGSSSSCRLLTVTRTKDNAMLLVRRLLLQQPRDS